MFYLLRDSLSALPFRMILACLSAAFMCLLLYPLFIKKLKALSFGQSVRDDGPQSHLKKQGTPTMGGLLLVISTIVSCLLWGNLGSLYLWLLIFVLLGFSLLGVLDDLKKVTKNNSLGLSARQKLFGQIVISLGAMLIYYANFSNTNYFSALSIPFVEINKFTLILPAWLYICFGAFIIVATSNSVNLTDGLDGLAIGPVISSALVFLCIAYSAHAGIFNLNIFYINNSNELAIFCAALIGASVGFLWYNTYPATIFMGDTGSLALGGALGMLAILTKNELLSVLLNGIFVAETLSVILQVISFKLRKKRIFKMAPLHHHFELLGYAEPKIIIRFWIISALLALFTLVSL